MLITSVKSKTFSGKDKTYNSTFSEHPDLLVSGTHDDGLVLFRGVLDGDALDLLVEALHAVAETRGR